MDNSFQRSGSDSDTQPQAPRGLIAAGLNIFEKTLNWLAGFVQLAEEEEWDAGIYLGEQAANDYQYSQYLDNQENNNDK